MHGQQNVEKGAKVVYTLGCPCPLYFQVAVLQQFRHILRSSPGVLSHLTDDDLIFFLF